MAEGDIEAAVIKHTQETLGKYVKKPPLSEKLLKKPPFRFLLDVFTAVIRDTGCFEGLYTPAELNYENIKDREDKMKFLQKMIDVIKITSNATLSVRTSKIVAGHEPAKTNELLQLMAEVIDKQLDWKSAVEKVVGGPDKQLENKDTTNPKPQEKQKVAKSTEKPKEKERTKETKAKDAKATTKNISPTTKDVGSTRRNSTTKEKDKAANKAVKEKTGKENREKDRTTRKVKEAADKSRPTPTKNDVKEKTPTPEKTEAKLERKSSVEKTKKPKDKLTRSVENGTMESPKQIARAAKDGSKSQTLPNATNDVNPPEEAPKKERRASKQNEELKVASIASPEKEKVAPEKEKVSPEKERISPEKEKNSPEKDKGPNESRKSSAQQRKASSGKSRRGSAGGTTKHESESAQTSLNSLEPQALSKLSEEEVPAVNQPAPPKPTPVPSAAATQNAVGLKREPTFTRESSKDSTGSTATNRPRTSLRPPSGRPASARPGAPRRRDKNVEIILQPNEQQKINGISLKLETFGDFDDDGENLVIIEDANAVNAKDSVDSAAVANAEHNLEQQGHLVQQILETQKELVQQNTESGSKTMKSSESTSALNGRQSSARQMNNLRNVIQNLTKSVNPFGSLMDFIPEDIDAMQLEMTMWRDAYTQANNELRREKNLTESATEPMKNQLVQIEANIKEYLEMIDVSRMKILQNSEKIIKMLTD